MNAKTPDSHLARKLNPEQLRRLSPLLDHALELNPEQCEPWLATLQGDDADLVPTLRGLLNQDTARRAHALLERPALQHDRLAQHGHEHQPGTVVDRFRLLRLIARGGMGEVWLAERADQVIKRQVALKLPVVKIQSDVLAQRLEAERDVLASLEHPHIARLYDAGTSAQGQPFLVLEYVDGLSIVEHCEAHQLAVRARVQLLVQVLDAVQYAHTRNVIHRDIKPSNVLVTPAGRTMLLDFGIAKVLDDGNAALAVSELTLNGGRAMTVQYAAPEQILNREVGVAADIWSLGVLLYRLVAGQLPFTATQRSELEHQILTATPAAPSSRQPAAAPRPDDRDARNLDAIILQALHKDPAQRHASASAMAHALQAWLQGDPVAGRTSARAILWGAGLALTVLLLGVTGWLGFDAAMSPSQPEPALAVAQREPLSIMVLPFANATGDAAQSYIADGLTASLSSDLARIRDIYVASIGSGLTYRDKPDPLKEIGAKLGVRFVLSGNIQRNVDRIRVNAQLSDTLTQGLLWSESFEGPLSDVLALQDMVTTRIANTIAPEMILATIKLPPPHARQAEVAQLTLQARALDLKRDTLTNLQDMEGLYRKILLIEPANASAMGRLARILSLQAVNFSHELAPEAVDARTHESFELATRVRELDPNNADVFSPIANYWRSRGDFRASMQAGADWVALEPKNPRAYVLLAYDKYFNVEPQSVITLLKTSISLQPRLLSTTEASNRSLGRAYFMLGDDASAIDWLQRALQINPKSAFAYQWLALAYARSGKLDKAREAAAEVRRLSPERRLATEKGYASTPPAFNRWFDTQVTPNWKRAGLQE